MGHPSGAARAPRNVTGQKRCPAGFPLRASLLAVFLLVLLAASLLRAAGDPPPGRSAGREDVPRIPTREERAEILERERPPAGERDATDGARAAARGSDEGAAVGVDALHYTLDLEFDSRDETITGEVTGQYEVLSPGLATLLLDLYDNMNVSSVDLGGTSLAFTHSGNLLTITLDRPYAAGETVEVTVAYSGSPLDVGWGSFVWSTHDGSPVFWSLSEPTGGPTWWPSVDDPSDKVTAEMLFTVGRNLVAVSNGTLVGTERRSGGRTMYHWQETYPIATYLISIACSDYETYTQTYTPLGGGTPMEIGYWIYPELMQEAQGTFASVPSIMSFFAGLFGEYPFIDEKYGIALFGWPGGMEHQTATSYGADYVEGHEGYIWLTVHELAHEWWGNSVTLQDWRETWLNEGFATYSEALYFEETRGEEYYHRYMDLTLEPGHSTDPLYDNPEPFGLLVYNKGAWVLHMLRHVIGDTSFFDLLPYYQSQHEYGNATTNALRADAEAVWGQDLGWFFDEWVFQGGRPYYEWGWSVADTGFLYVVYLHVEQKQTGQTFQMPLDIRFETMGPSIDTTVWNDAQSTDYVIPLLALPTDVIFDPDHYVLRYETQVTLPDADADGVPDTADNCGGTPNPAQENVDGDALGDACDPDADNDGILNPSDCAPLDAGAFALPAETPTLSVDAAALAWSSLAGQAGAGTVYDVVRGSAGDLPSDGGIGGAVCFAPGEAALSIAHGPDPAPGAVRYFLVRGSNACGDGTYGNASSGAERINAACP